MFEKRVMRIFHPKRRRCQEAGEYCMMRTFIICTPHQYYEGVQIKGVDI